MDIKKVAVIGSGLMGNQIAMQTAIHGYEVVCYDINPEMVSKAEAFSDNLPFYPCIFLLVQQNNTR